MALKANQVWETSTFTGAGDVTGLTVVVKSFNAAFGTGASNTFRYFIRNRAVPGEYEEGIGYLSDSTTLVRQTVIASSNSNSAVDFSSGLKDVTHDLSASEVGSGNAGLGTNLYWAAN